MKEGSMWSKKDASLRKHASVQTCKPLMRKSPELLPLPSKWHIYRAGASSLGERCILSVGTQRSERSSLPTDNGTCCVRNEVPVRAGSKRSKRVCVDYVYPGAACMRCETELGGPYIPNFVSGLASRSNIATTVPHVSSSRTSTATCLMSIT